MNFLLDLRQSTITQHEALERDLDLLRADLDVCAYERLLKRFYGFYKPWECAVEKIASERQELKFNDRRKLPLLTADLLFLDAKEVDFSKIPCCGDLPATEDSGQVLGSMYVIEGSTLGGQPLSRHFDKTLGLKAGAGCSFFNGYGERTGSMWNSFREVMNGAAVNSDVQSAMLESAKNTFRRLHDWLCVKELATEGDAS